MEVLEIVLAIQIILKHDSTEKIDTECRIDKEHQKYKLHDIRYLWQNVKHCVKNQSHMN